VAGSAIQAFEEVCPERIDLIHKNYRKLCTLLVDVEEWGQVIIINMMTRYARTQFVNPNQDVSIQTTAGWVGNSVWESKQQFHNLLAASSNIGWSVVTEWLRCRTLNQRVIGSNPGEDTAWYL
jgi:hypothetical protein